MKVKYIPNHDGRWATKTLDFATLSIWLKGNYDYNPLAFIRFLFSL